MKKKDCIKYVYYKYLLPIIEGLSGTGYAARQIKGELIPVHDGGQYHDELNLHKTIIVSVFITINDNIANRPIPSR